MSSLPLGNTTDITGFSPADFGDADDTRPLAAQFDPTGTGSLTPYSMLVSNVLLRHTTEIKEKTVSPSPSPPNWRKRLREFMTTKNEDLITFLKKPLDRENGLVRADVFLGKFGRSDFSPTHASLQTSFLDASGVSQIPALDQELKTIGPSSSKEIVEQIRWLYDAYRVAGEECIKRESQLRLRLDVLDKSYQKVISICELPVNEESEKVGIAVEGYIKKLVEENQIEEHYNACVEAYRRFAGLKEMIQFIRFTELQDKEPLCSICLAETVGFALTPCGHTFCGTCVKRQVHTCYMCRTHIRDRVKLYFG
jgi:hypothetical protein